MLSRSRVTCTAIASYNTALQLKPNHPDAHNNLGNAQGARRPKRCHCLLQHRSSAQAQPPRSSQQPRQCSQEQGDLSAAIASYKTALQLKPNYPEAHYNLGIALNEQGDLTAAIASYNTTLQLKPNHPDAHINLGNALQERRPKRCNHLLQHRSSAQAEPPRSSLQPRHCSQRAG